MMLRTRLSVLVLLAVSLSHPAFGQGKTQTRLFLSADRARPGETVWAGLELKMAPNWHTYWRNSGDAGLATTIKWTLPPGVTAGDINWPLPEKSIVSSGDISLCTYIYEDDVVLLVPIKLDTRLSAGPVKLSAAIAWLECSDIGGCVPGTSIVSADLTVGNAAKPSFDAPLIELWRARVPQASPPPRATARWESSGPGDIRTVVIDFESAGASADFYPYEHQPADVEGTTEDLPAPPGHFRLRKVVRKYEGRWPEKLVGILVTKGGSGNLASMPGIPKADAVDIVIQSATRNSPLK